ncbi:MAG: GAF domain-containing protein, partial [Chloroflexota bacterium]
VIHLMNVEKGVLEFKARIPDRNDTYKPPRNFAVGEGIAGQVVQDNKSIYIPDIRKDSRVVDPVDAFKSLLVAPISWRSACAGTISVTSRDKNAFNPRHERFLTSLANLAMVPIENSHLHAKQQQLYEESQERLEIVERRNRELRSLRDVLGALQSTLSLTEVLTQVTQGIVQGLNYRVVFLSTVDEPAQFLTVQDIAMTPELAQSGLLERAEALLGRKLLGTRTPLQKNKDNVGVQVYLDEKARVTQSLYEIFQPELEKLTCTTLQHLLRLKTFAVLPIRSEGQPFGILYAGTNQPDLTAGDLEALQAFANQTSLAIQNARQFEHIHERLRRRVGELHGLQDIDRLISSSSDLETALTSILDVCLKLVTAADQANILLIDERTGQLALKVSYPNTLQSSDQFQKGLAAWVAKTHRTTHVGDLSQTAWASIYANIPVRSEMGTPILAREELVGVITLGSANVDAFTEEDESLLDIIATQTAVATQTIRYYQELEKSRRRSFEAERIAAMSDMASNMVHNINNSIGAIRVLVQQIRFKISRNNLTPEFLDKKLDGIESSAERTLDMARNIRNPFQNLETELIDVNQSIQRIVDNIETVPTTLEIILKLDQTLPQVTATHQIDEVFRNLVNNAIQSMKGLGTLEIESRQVNHMVEVIVSDTGPGISPDLTETSVFSLGVSSKKDGLGFGLWWCKIYLNRVGGSIELDGAVAEGCTFIIKLPVWASENERVVQS